MATYDVPIASETTSQEIKSDVSVIKTNTNSTKTDVETIKTNVNTINSNTSSTKTDVELIKANVNENIPKINTTKAGVEMLLNAVQGTTVTDPTATRSHMLSVDFRKALPAAGERATIAIMCVVVNGDTVLASSTATIGGADTDDDILVHTMLYNAAYSVRDAVVKLYLRRYGEDSDGNERYVNVTDEAGYNRVLIGEYRIDLTNTATYVDIEHLITRRADDSFENQKIHKIQKMFDFRECDEAIYKLMLDLYKADLIDIKKYWHIGDTRYYTISGICPAGNIDGAYYDSIAIKLLDYKLPSNIEATSKEPINQLLIGIYAYKKPNGGLYFESKFGGNSSSKASYYNSDLASFLHTSLNSLSLYHEYYAPTSAIPNGVMMDYVAPVRITMLAHNGTNWCAYVGKATSTNRFYVVPTLPNIVGKIGIDVIDKYGGEQIEYFKKGLELRILGQSSTDVHTQSPVTDANGAHYAVTLSSVNPSKMYDASSGTAYKTTLYSTELQTLVLAVAN